MSYFFLTSAGRAKRAKNQPENEPEPDIDGVGCLLLILILWFLISQC